MSQVPSNINEIFSSVIATGLAYSNRFEVLINYPPAFTSMGIDSARQLAVRCDAITVPGRGFSTTPYRFYGPARNMPYEPLYSGELTMSVIVSDDLRERAFFEAWMNAVCSQNDYKFNYYDQYTAPLVISVLDRSSAVKYQILVEEAYPKAIGDIQLAYDKNDEFVRQDVTIAYRKYSPVTIQPNITVSGPPSPEKSFAIYSPTPGQFYRVGSDGTVNGIYDPDLANALQTNSIVR
jgi:hypothetical protein